MMIWEIFYEDDEYYVDLYELKLKIRKEYENVYG